MENQNIPSGEGRKVVLAYSGGLDTTVIASWLQEKGWEVVTFTADIGQGEELEGARTTAQSLGIESIYIEDLRQRFVKEFVWPMFRANAVYEGEYLLGTAIARPLVSQRLVEIARAEGASAVAHGATGKGNDQVRFELGVMALDPKLKVIAPWRDWEFESRSDLVAYCRSHQLPVEIDEAGRPPWSMDANSLHISYEGGVLEDPNYPAPDDMWRRTNSLVNAPDTPSEIQLQFKGGDCIGVDGQELPAHEVLDKLNEVGCLHGIGRLDIVENRMVGMKSRGCYETPGGTILLKAHRAVESLALDGHLAHLKDEIMPRYADLIYQGLWFSPEREALQAFIDKASEHVDGEVTLQLYKGNVSVLGRQSENSLYDADLASFEGDYDYRQADAEGYIRIKGLRLMSLNKITQKR